MDTVHIIVEEVKVGKDMDTVQIIVEEVKVAVQIGMSGE
jgi:phenylpyruvate tautomerase PptA (4-oxalocrotonate tautomerase family)